MTDQNKHNNPEEVVEEVEETVVLEDAEGTEVEETPEEEREAQKAKVEAEVEEITPTHATPNAATSLLNLESLINGYFVDLEKAQEKLKTQRDMFNDAFENDAEYSQVMQKVKEVNRAKATAKQRIQKLPSVVEVANKMKEYKSEIKDINEGLSSYLQQYREMSGSNQLTRDNGEVVEIINVTKFVKRKG